MIASVSATAIDPGTVVDVLVDVDVDEVLDELFTVVEVDELLEDELDPSPSEATS